MQTIDVEWLQTFELKGFGLRITFNHLTGSLCCGIGAGQLLYSMPVDKPLGRVEPGSSCPLP